MSNNGTDNFVESIGSFTIGQKVNENQINEFFQNLIASFRKNCDYTKLTTDQ
jgi:hypothetical protein